MEVPVKKSLPVFLLVILHTVAMAGSASDYCLQMRSPGLGLASPCNTYSGKLCITGQMSGIYKPDSTWYSSDSYWDNSVQYNFTTQHSIYFSSKYGANELYNSPPFKGLQLKNAQVSVCDGIKDSLLLSTFDSTFIFFPDSIPISVGDTVILDHYIATWLQDIPMVWRYRVLSNGSFVVNGTSYEQPVAISERPSLKSSGISVVHHPDGLRISNQGKLSRIVRLVGIDGRIVQTLALESNESRFVKTSPLTLVVPKK